MFCTCTQFDTNQELIQAQKTTIARLCQELAFWKESALCGWQSSASVGENDPSNSKFHGKALENIDKRISGLASSLGFSLGASLDRRLPRKLEVFKSEFQRDLHESTDELVNASMPSYED